MIRVAVETRSPIYRAGLEALLRDAGFEVVPDAADAEVLLLANEFDEVRSPEALPVVLIADEPPPLNEAIEAGVRSVLPRDASPVEIEAAVRAAAAGLVAMRLEDIQAMSARPPAESNAEVGSPLTPREIEVLRMIAEGLPNKTIAWKLGISEHTVKFHVTSILNRLGASSRAEAVAIGIRRGLILL